MREENRVLRLFVALLQDFREAFRPDERRKGAILQTILARTRDKS